MTSDLASRVRAATGQALDLAELPVTECPCHTNNWAGDSRIEHYGRDPHTRCDGHGNHRRTPRAVEHWFASSHADTPCFCGKRTYQPEESDDA